MRKLEDRPRVYNTQIVGVLEGKLELTEKS